MTEHPRVTPRAGMSGRRHSERRGGGGLGLAILGWTVDSSLAFAAGVPALERRARMRQRRIARWARIASPYYRDLYRELPPDINRLDALPPVTKPHLMDRFDDWLADPAVTRDGLRPWLRELDNIGHLYRGQYLVYTTSGTTGEPALLVQDRHALALYLASRVRFLPALFQTGVVKGFASGQGRTAALIATGGPYGGVVMAEWARRHHPLGRHLTIFSVGDPIEKIVSGLNRQRPAAISGYASALTLLADEAAAGRLQINPALMVSSAEGLTPEGRQRIASAWDTEIFEAYGASEALTIAFGCGAGALHQNIDWVTLEPVDAHYRPVPIGEPSHTVLITNLANRVQPIIRYDLGDSVTLLPGTCPCGNPLPMIRVEGRSGDILSLTAPDGTIARVLPLAIGSDVEEVAGVRRVQIVQTTPTALTVKLEPEAGANRATVASDVQRSLESFLARQGLANVAIVVSEDLPRSGPSGKFRQVYRDVSVDVQ